MYYREKRRLEKDTRSLLHDDAPKRHLERTMIGNQWAREFLARAANHHVLGHAYLFLGPPSVGKTSLALHLGALGVCEQARENPCGVCRGCRHVKQSSHPDVRIVERAADRRDITIDQIREVELDLAMAPYEATRKLVCIAGAEALNESAASALLKTLEEPPPRATLVLCATSPQSLPLTVRSRCQTMLLHPVPAHAIAEGLHEDLRIEMPRAIELASAARGRPGWAVRAATLPELFEREHEAGRQVDALATLGPLGKMMAAETWLGKGTFLESRERAMELFSRLESWWRDALLETQLSPRPALAAHLSGERRNVRVEPRDAVGFLLHIQAAAARVESNVTPRLAVEHLLSQMPPVGRI